MSFDPGLVGKWWREIMAEQARKALDLWQLGAIDRRAFAEMLKVDDQPARALVRLAQKRKKDA
jgi:hypothetical protein